MKTTLIVLGRPIPEGSSQASPYLDKDSGRMRASVRPNNARDLYRYRADIQNAWDQTMPSPDLIEGPVILHCTFVFARPDSHFYPVNKKRSKPELRKDAPHYRTVKPDLDKLLRAVGDALTGRAYKDDSQVVQTHGAKPFGDACQTIIEVMAMDDLRDES
jgi:Holliday junction resolvase RusA-like endonuclease